MLPNKNRPNAEAYMNLLNSQERQFTTEIISFISSIVPHDIKIAAILGGSASRQYDKKLFGLPKRVPRDIDLAFTSGARNFYRVDKKTQTAEENLFYDKVEDFFSKKNLTFDKNVATSKFMFVISTTVQYITKKTEKMRPFDIMFYEFFDYDATESLLELMRHYRSPGVVLADERGQDYIAQQIKEREEIKEKYGSY